MKNLQDYYRQLNAQNEPNRCPQCDDYDCEDFGYCEDVWLYETDDYKNQREREIKLMAGIE